MLCKKLNKSAVVSWSCSSKFPSLLVSGTIAGTIDDSFQTNSQLEIYDVNLDNIETNMKCIGTLITKDCFHKLTWGNKGMDDNMYPMGIIAGGMSDGSVNLWNPDAIIKNEINKSLIARIDAHKGNVLALQFHPVQQNLFSSGATDGEVLIYDLARPTLPTFSTAGQKQPGASGVCALEWNKKVFQIVASSSQTGDTSIWDLRQKRCVISFKESTHTNCMTTGLAWNPLISTQIVVTYANSTPEIWDLRKSIAPKMRLEGSNCNSILSVAWNQHDPTILMTSGDNGVTLLWDTLTGRPIHQLPLQDTTGGLFELHWNPFVPGLLASSSHDSHVNIHSVHNTGPNAPSWLKRPCSAQFGFGGKLAIVEADPSYLIPPEDGKDKPFTVKSHKAVIKHVSTANSSTISNCQTFQDAMAANDLKGFCDNKIGQSVSEVDRATWKYMKVMLEENSREKVLRNLGFATVVPEPATVAETGSILDSSDALPSEQDFFSKLEGDTEPVIPTIAAVKIESKPVVPKPDISDASDDLVSAAIFVGDFNKAVKICVEFGRDADALVLASMGGPELYAKTQKSYLENHQRPFFRKTVQSIARTDYDELIRHADIKNWGETLAIITTYTKDAQYRQLCTALGTVLASRQTVECNVAAIICFLCAANVDSAVHIWLNDAKANMKSASDSDRLQSLIEKVYVFSQAIKNLNLTSALNSTVTSKFSEYAAWLATEGHLSSALQFLTQCRQDNSGSKNDALAVLYHRLFHALPYNPNVQVPTFPFENSFTPLSNPQHHQGQNQRGGRPNSSPPPPAKPQQPNHMNNVQHHHPNQMNNNQYVNNQQQPNQMNTPRQPISSGLPNPMAPNAPNNGPQRSNSLTNSQQPPIPGQFQTPQRPGLPPGGQPPLMSNKPNMPNVMMPKPAPNPVSAMTSPPLNPPPVQLQTPKLMTPKPLGQPVVSMNPPLNNGPVNNNLPSNQGMPNMNRPNMPSSMQPNPNMSSNANMPQNPNMPPNPQANRPGFPPSNPTGPPVQNQNMSNNSAAPLNSMARSVMPPQNMQPMGQNPSFPPNQMGQNSGFTPNPNIPNSGLVQNPNLPSNPNIPPQMGMPNRPGMSSNNMMGQNQSMPSNPNAPPQNPQNNLPPNPNFPPSNPNIPPSNSNNLPPNPNFPPSNLSNPHANNSLPPNPNFPPSNNKIPQNSNFPPSNNLPPNPNLPAMGQNNPNPNMPPQMGMPNRPLMPSNNMMAQNQPMPNNPQSFPQMGNQPPSGDNLPSRASPPNFPPATPNRMIPQPMSNGSQSTPMRPQFNPNLAGMNTQQSMPNGPQSTPMRPQFNATAPTSGNIGGSAPRINAPTGQLSNEGREIMDGVNACISRLDGLNLQLGDSAKLTDIKKRLGNLQEKLQNNDISSQSLQKVQQLVAALNSKQYPVANTCQVSLMSTEWNQHKQWLPGVKSLIAMAQQNNC